MSFLALLLDADLSDAERWSDALIAAGAFSVDVADSGAGTASESPRYAEPGTDQSLWDKNRLTALFAADADVERALAAAAEAMGAPAPAHEIEEVPDTDWVRATQAQFGPLQVSDDLWIVPSWSQSVDARAINLRIDPGLAFGTGSHPTTLLCLRWLACRLPRGASVLDYGCGSGVLAIAAAKLGASVVTGVDIDAEAIAVSRANALANGATIKFGLPEEIGNAGPFEVLIANILADPLELLAPVLASRVRSGGSIVLSGILERQAPALIAVYSRWFNIKVWAREAGWVALAGARIAI